MKGIAFCLMALLVALAGCGFDNHGHRSRNLTAPQPAPADTCDDDARTASVR